MLQSLQVMQILFFLIQCPIDASLDISWDVILPQAPRQCMDMLVETDYIRQGFLANE